MGNSFTLPSLTFDPKWASGFMEARLPKISTNAIAAVDSGWRYPTDPGAPITSGYGPRPSMGDTHPGVDIGVPTGTPVYAAQSGVVRTISNARSGGYGNLVQIDHGNGLTSKYGHLSAFEVVNGARVNAGQLIGYSGNTGHSTGPHLHFEIDQNGQPVDPTQYIGGAAPASNSDQPPSNPWDPRNWFRYMDPTNVHNWIPGDPAAGTGAADWGGIVKNTATMLTLGAVMLALIAGGFAVMAGGGDASAPKVIPI